MKNFVMLICAFFMILLLFDCEPHPTPEPEIIFSADFDDDLIAQAKKLNIYELKPSEANRETFLNLAEQLYGGKLGSGVIEMNGVISMADTGQSSNYITLELKTGFTSFNRGMADQIDDKPDNLPKDDEAVSIAQKFLSDTKFMPDNLKELIHTKVGHIRSVSYDPQTDTEGSVRDQISVVYFGRTLDDTPVTGSGSKMIVRIGDEGKVVGGTRRWNECEQGRTIEPNEFLSLEQVKENIISFLKKEMGNATKIEIVKFTVAYYDNGGNFIQPVLAYEAKILGKELNFNYFTQTQLLQEPPELVGPEPIPAEALKLIRKSDQDAKPPAGDSD